MKKHFLLGIVALLSTAPVLPAADPAPEKIKVLIVDGQNNHDWRSTTPHMKKWLEACGRFTVDVATTPARPQRAEAEDRRCGNAGQVPAATRRIQESPTGVRGGAGEVCTGIRQISGCAEQL